MIGNEGFHQRIVNLPFGAKITTVGMLRTITSKKPDGEGYDLYIRCGAVDDNGKYFAFFLLGNDAKRNHLLLKKGAWVYIDRWYTASIRDIGGTKYPILHVRYISALGHQTDELPFE